MRRERFGFRLRVESQLLRLLLRGGTCRLHHLAPTGDISPSCTMLPVTEMFSTGLQVLLLIDLSAVSSALNGNVFLSLIIGLHKASITAARSRSQL